MTKGQISPSSNGSGFNPLYRGVLIVTAFTDWLQEKGKGSFNPLYRGVLIVTFSVS